MGKYSLIAIDKDGNRELVRMKENNPKGEKNYKTKVNLATIDKNTTYFKNQKQMSDYLVKSGKVSIVPTKFRIEYTLKGIKCLPLVFNNNKILYYLSHQANSYVPCNDPYFLELFNRLLNQLKNPNFYRFITEKGYLNDYLREKISTYIYNPEQDQTNPEFIRTKILEEMSSYKIVRGLVIGMAIYDTYGYNPLKKEKQYDSLDSKELEKAKTEADVTEQYAEVIDTFMRGGYDELYKHYSIDELYCMPDVILKQLKLKK